MITFTEMEQRLDRWQLAKYQTPTVDYRKATTKFSEECIEAHKAIHTEDTANLKEEVADVLFTLHRIARALGTDLMTLAEVKLVDIETKLERKQKENTK